MIGSRYQSIESYTKFRDKDSVQREVLWIDFFELRFDARPLLQGCINCPVDMTYNIETGRTETGVKMLKL